MGVGEKIFGKVRPPRLIPSLEDNVGNAIKHTIRLVDCAHVFIHHT